MGALPSRSALIWVTFSARPRALRARNPAPPVACPCGPGLLSPPSYSSTSAAYPRSTSLSRSSLLASPALSSGNVDPPSVTTGKSAGLRPASPRDLRCWRVGDVWRPGSAVRRESREE